MRSYSTIGWLLLGVCACLVFPEATPGQEKGTKGNNKGGNLPRTMDRKADFDKMAEGKPYFLLSQVAGNTSLHDFAKEKGVTNGQITFALFSEYREQQKGRWGLGGGGAFFPGGGKGPSPGGSNPGVIVAPPPGVTVLSPQQQQDSGVLNDLADKEFRRRDQNEDGRLNSEEMPGSLRENLERWDTSKDGLIDTKEYRPYYIAKLKGEGDSDRNKGKKTNPTAIIIIDEENWDVRPKVLRAGNLHPDLPSWFRELDADADGQVALFDWRLKKPIDEFRTWDGNNDGLITQEEALKLKGAIVGGSVASGTRPGERPSMGATPGGPPGGFGGMRDLFRKGGDGGFKSKKDRQP